jgi:hypothetical protein
MARMFVDGDDMVLHLSLREHVAARHGDVRVPLAALCRVTVEPDWWRALRGEPGRGVWVPGVQCIGICRHQAGKDFVAIRPGGRPVVCVELRPSESFSLLAVSAPTRAVARAMARSLAQAMPRVDASTPFRQPLRVPEEFEGGSTALELLPPAPAPGPPARREE